MKSTILLLLIGFVFFAAELVSFGAAACDDGWEAFGEHCYKLVNGEFTNAEAVGNCSKQEGGILASIHGPEEQKFLLDLASSTDASVKHCFWIGLMLVHDCPSFGTLISATWMDGTQMDYGGNVKQLVPGEAPWASGDDVQPLPEPNNLNGVEQCVALSTKPAGWADYKCNGNGNGRGTTFGYICKK